jgi:hypothetical protein
MPGQKPQKRAKVFEIRIRALEKNNTPASVSEFQPKLCPPNDQSPAMLNENP